MSTLCMYAMLDLDANMINNVDVGACPGVGFALGHTLPRS